MYANLSTTHACTYTPVINATDDHRLYWVTCPHCTQPMHYRPRERYLRGHYALTLYGKCLNDDCGYRGWIAEIDADVWAYVQGARAGVAA